MIDDYGLYPMQHGGDPFSAQPKSILEMLYGYQQPETRGDILAGILKSGAGMSYNLRPTNLKAQQGMLGEMGELANAQYNPDNPLYQRLYGQEKDAANQDLAAVIAEMSRQNRKLSSLGRTPLFSPERGGEQMFRATIQGHQDAQNMARMRAREILGGGQRAMATNFGAQNQLTAMQDQNKKKKAFGLGNIADALPLLGKLF